MGSWFVTNSRRVEDYFMFKKHKSVLGLVPIREAILICLWALYNPCLKACGGFIMKRTEWGFKMRMKSIGPTLEMIFNVPLG